MVFAPKSGVMEFNVQRFVMTFDYSKEIYVARVDNVLINTNIVTTHIVPSIN